MDAKKVEILLEAVESGSMMGIAGQNGYTPSGLSHLLRRLEAELGVQLVERTNRGIALSENGKRLLPYLRGYVESFETLEREAALLRNETETTLRLGAYASIAKNWMPALLRAFGKAYPQIRVELEVLSRQELYRAMKEDRLHLIFACEDQTQPYHFLHLADDPFYAVLPSTEESLQAITLPPLSGEQEDAIPAAKKGAVLQEGAWTEQRREEPRAVRLSQQMEASSTAQAGKNAKNQNAAWSALSEAAATAQAGKNAKNQNAAWSALSEAAATAQKFAIADFEKYPFIMPSYGEDVEVHEALAEHQVHPRLLPASADDPVILGMVSGGMGVTMLSELVLRGSSEPVRKVPLLPTIVRPLGIVYRDMHVLRAAEQCFLQFVKTGTVRV